MVRILFVLLMVASSSAYSKPKAAKKAAPSKVCRIYREDGKLASSFVVNGPTDSQECKMQKGKEGKADQ